MTRVTAHIINHTHWDREWFLTSVYTSRWIAGLIDRLAELVESNPDFHFFLDGQTLVIEDLLQIAPQYQAKVEGLVRGGNLLIGPYYCQPDWRLTAGEALLRNLLYGRQDRQQYQGEEDEPGEGTNEVGWLVDTFGHISQAPQLHHLFGIHSVYIWRGAPQLEPFFQWQGADGTRSFTVNLFGGYRNLYGVTHAPEVAIKRLQVELQRLLPYYPTADIPLFDGYDLEDNPEDPLRFYQDLGLGGGLGRDRGGRGSRGRGSRGSRGRSETYPYAPDTPPTYPSVPPEIQVVEATPASFALEMRPKLQDLPTLAGELMSGKYGAVFPGTLSARTYLKVMARDCEGLLYGVCEPLAVMARLRGRPYPQEQYESWSRGLLQNAVHDCICGVSIDQVHEKMEFSYRQIYEELLADLGESLEAIFQDFAPGAYAVSANPFPYEGWQVFREKLIHIQTLGVGVWEIGEHVRGEHFPIQNTGKPVETFVWKNRHYEARVHADGTVQVGADGVPGAVLGRLLVAEERGDTYSDETGAFLGVLQPVGPLRVLQKSDLHCVLGAECSMSWDQGQVSARLRLTFDPSPLIRWQIDLDSRGTDFRVDIVFETGHPGGVYAGMPFDVVQRLTVDRDLLPRRLEGSLAAVLLGQRELGATETFPFQDFLAISDGAASALVLAKGLHAYQADGKGRLTLTLRRAVEWLTKPDLENRVGDAGPFFYVPDARCERSVTHELAAAFVGFGPEDPQLQALNAGFQNPPLLVDSHAAGTRTGWQFFHETLPLSSLHIADGRVLARVFNPASRPQRLSQAFTQTDVSGRPQTTTLTEIPPKSIVTLAIPEPPTEIHRTAASGHPAGSRVELINAPTWRVGPNQGRPNPAIIAQLKEKIASLELKIEEADAQLSQAALQERYHWQHRIYVLQREQLEYRLSARLNEIKLALQGQFSRETLYEPDEEIAALGRQLNTLRIRRRIYDYIVQAV